MTNGVELVLTPSFRKRCEATGLTQTALAAALGVTEEEFKRIWRKETDVSVRFMAGARSAGLASNIDEIAEWATAAQNKTAA